MDVDDLRRMVRDVPDFPVRGILFRDITTLLKDPAGFKASVDMMAERLQPLQRPEGGRHRIRGALSLARRWPICWGRASCPARKLGKLPAATVSAEYALEYGTNSVEMHRDAISPGERVIIVDDLLATGGTTRATIQLVQHLGGQVVALAYLIELSFLKAREQFDKYDIVTLIQYH